MVTIMAWLLMVTCILVTLTILVLWVRLVVFSSREGRRDMATPLSALLSARLSARRRAIAAARHAALPPVRVVSVKTVNERKALP